MNKGTSITITGGHGFLGRAVMARLSALGYRQVSTFRSSEFDLTSQAEAERAFFYIRPEVVIHLAARVGGIGANMNNPGKFAYDNMAMGLNVIEQCRKYGVSKLVTVGTVCSYPCHARVPFREKNIWKGYPEPTNAPYGLAKKMLLVLSQAYRQQYGCDFIYLIPVNMFGPGDNFDPSSSHVIPAMMRKLHEGKVDNKPITLWGDGTPTREFLYVDDCARAIVTAMESYDEPDPINVGTGREISMSDLASKIAKIVGYEGPISWNRSMPNGQPRRRMDVSRAKNKLGWKASTTLEDGLSATYDYFLREIA